MADEKKACVRPDCLVLFRCFRIASDPVKVGIGFLGVAATLFVLILVLAALVGVRQRSGGEASRKAVQAFRNGDLGASVQLLGQGAQDTITDLGRELTGIARSLRSADLPAALRRAQTLKKMLPWGLGGLLLLWMVWAYFGGAISRAAAYELATGERLSGAEVRAFASSRYSSYLWAPLTLFLIIVALVLCMMAAGLAASHLLSALAILAGLLASMYVGVVVKQKAQSGAAGGAAGVAGLAVTAVAAWLLWGAEPPWLGRVGLVVLAFPVSLVAGLAAVLGTIVLLFGRGIMTAAISYEGTETFDAISRAGDYVLKRPWRLLFYWLVGLAYGLPCLIVVGLMAAASFFIALAALWVGFGPSFSSCYDLAFSLDRPASFVQWLPAFLLRALIVLLGGVVVGWGVSFLQSFRTICYALIRKSVDLSEISEVYHEAGHSPGPAA